jgi:uncharacterized membrane protein
MVSKEQTVGYVNAEERNEDQENVTYLIDTNRQSNENQSCHHQSATMQRVKFERTLPPFNKMQQDL